MTGEPQTLPPDASLQDAARHMTAGRFRHLPVVKDGQVLGVVSQRDLVAAGVAGG